MRSQLVFQAMRNIPNRFTLCSMTSTYLRKVHSNGASFSTSINLYFESVQDVKIDNHPMPAAPAVVEPISTFAPVIAAE